jgi:hypothetical protein
MIKLRANDARMLLTISSRDLSPERRIPPRRRIRMCRNAVIELPWLVLAVE